MRAPVFAILMVLGLSACDTDFLVPVQKTFSIDPMNQSDRVLDIIADATAVWNEHGIDFALMEGGAILLGYPRDPYASSEYMVDDVGRRYVLVGINKTDANQTCAVAKHLGLATGMEQVEGRALLGNQTVQDDQSCLWSQQDRDELCRKHDVCFAP